METDAPSPGTVVEECADGPLGAAGGEATADAEGVRAVVFDGAVMEGP